MERKENFMPELVNSSDRLHALQTEAAKVEQTDYRVFLTPEELDQRREQFTNNSIWLKEEGDKFNDVKVEYKERIKPKATENETLIDEIVTRQRKQTGTLYHIPSYDESIMITYDEKGEWISERRLTPEEKKGQSRLFIASKNGTNG